MKDEVIHYKCPHCGAPLSIPSRYAGGSGKCRHCRGAISVPRETPVAAVAAIEAGPEVEQFLLAASRGPAQLQCGLAEVPRLVAALEQSLVASRWDLDDTGIHLSIARGFHAVCASCGRVIDPLAEWLGSEQDKAGVRAGRVSLAVLSPRQELCPRCGQDAVAVSFVPPPEPKPIAEPEPPAPAPAKAPALPETTGPACYFCARPGLSPYLYMVPLFKVQDYKYKEGLTSNRETWAYTKEFVPIAMCTRCHKNEFLCTAGGAAGFLLGLVAGVLGFLLILQGNQRPGDDPIELTFPVPFAYLSARGLLLVTIVIGALAALGFIFYLDFHSKMQEKAGKHPGVKRLVEDGYKVGARPPSSPV